jgi:hypothetical protein
MPITSKKYQFTGANIDAFAEEGIGVFGLYNPINNVLYYGHSNDGVKKCLKSYLAGNGDNCAYGAAYFNTEHAIDPEQRANELLEEYRVIHGKLPRYNKASK